MVPRCVALPVTTRLRRIATNQLAEEALLAARRSFLIEQRQTGIIEFAEEFVPGNFLETFVMALGALGNIKRMMPGSLPRCVALTAAGLPPRASAHFRI